MILKIGDYVKHKEYPKNKTVLHLTRQIEVDKSSNEYAYSITKMEVKK